MKKKKVSAKTEYLQMRITPQMKKELQQLADNSGEYVSDVVTFFIQDGIQRHYDGESFIEEVEKEKVHKSIKVKKKNTKEIKDEVFSLTGNAKLANMVSNIGGSH